MIKRDYSTAAVAPLLDRIAAMRKQEQTKYAYRNFSSSSLSSLSETETEDLASWREKICHWTYSVIDHFELHRETVALSINLFDRFIATRGFRCDGSLALLTSLATLYIAIKANEKKKIKLSTLTQLSRGQFGPDDIESMELKILQDLTWLVNPPSVVEFLTLLLRFLPPEVQLPVRTEMFELSRYLAELAVCDPFFIECDASTIAFAAILNVLESDVSLKHMSLELRERYLRELQSIIGIHRGKASVRNARDRLQKMHSVGGENQSTDKENNSQKQSRLSDDIRDELMRDSNDSSDPKYTKTASERFRTDSIESASVCSRSSRGSRGSKGSKGSKKRFLRGRAGSMVTPCTENSRIA